mmetsp:Transcript_136909/g.193644  ORF Transcript_136909/g.193644 Transcript_136909/m.193644 type:complete len:212 (-) Transcript_136909:519-1154(-)
MLSDHLPQEEGILSRQRGTHTGPGLDCMHGVADAHGTHLAVAPLLQGGWVTIQEEAGIAEALLWGQGYELLWQRVALLLSHEVMGKLLHVRLGLPESAVGLRGACGGVMLLAVRVDKSPPCHPLALTVDDLGTHQGKGGRCHDVEGVFVVDIGGARNDAIYDVGPNMARRHVIKASPPDGRMHPIGADDQVNSCHLLAVGKAECFLAALAF